MAKGTVIKLLADIGKVCSEYQDKVLRDLECNEIQCDEIWSFCAMKKKNVPDDKRVNMVMVMFIHILLFVLIQSLSQHGM